MENVEFDVNAVFVIFAGRPPPEQITSSLPIVFPVNPTIFNVSFSSIEVVQFVFVV